MTHACVWQQLNVGDGKWRDSTGRFACACAWQAPGVTQNGEINSTRSAALSPFSCDNPRMQVTSDDLIAAAAMAAAATAQAEAASRRTSLCMTGPQMSGLLDSMLLDSMGAACMGQLQAPRQSMDLSAAGAALALQSSLYGSAAPALDAQLQAPVSTAGLGMPSQASLAMQRSPARHSLDCSLLGAPGLSAAALGAMAGLPSPGAVHASAMAGLPSPAGGRASLHLAQAPLLGDRGLAMTQTASQAHSDAAGWGFSARRNGGGRASMDAQLPKSHAPDLSHMPPRKSVSMLTPGCNASKASAGSSNSSGRSSPRSNKPAPAQSQGSRRMSMDKPPTQPPKWSPSASSMGKPLPDGASAAATATATVSTAAARKGTGVFIPSCMFKSS
jgi:hypothetical protein